MEHPYYTFRAYRPSFRRRADENLLAKAEQSPYYWWWLCLKRHEGYLKCCEQQGKGQYADLYKDFGDVRGNDLRAWWLDNERGYKLFAEPLKETQLREIQSPQDWEDYWSRENELVLVVPLTAPKIILKKAFNDILKRRHPAKRGKKPLKGKDTSNAYYPLAGNFNVNAIKIALEVYDAVKLAESEAKKNKTKRKSYFEIAKGIKGLSVGKDRGADVRNEVTKAMIRHYRHAVKLIDGVGKGIFPAS